MKKSNFLRMQEFALLAFLTLASAAEWHSIGLNKIHLMCTHLVSTKLFSFTFGALLSYIHEGKLLLLSENQLCCSKRIEPHLFRA